MPVFLQDIICLLKSGKRPILSIFLKLHDLFERDDLRYLVNKLYLVDYIVWIQSCKSLDKEFTRVLEEIEADVNLSELKEELNAVWKLEAYEKLIQEDENSTTGSVADYLEEESSSEVSSSCYSSDHVDDLDQYSTDREGKCSSDNRSESESEE